MRILILFGLFAALFLLAPASDCRASGVCASTTCLYDSECGSCRCATVPPGPQGYCVGR